MNAGSCVACTVDPDSAACLHHASCEKGRRWQEIAQDDARWMAENGTNRRERGLLPLEIDTLRALAFRVDDLSARRWMVVINVRLDGAHHRLYRRSGRTVWSVLATAKNEGPRAGDAGASGSAADIADRGDATSESTPLRLVGGPLDQAIDAAVRRHPAGKRPRSGGSR